MLHLGDITKISGYDVPPVDCVIGGSPCQDLSIAGKRAGLAGARSGLFMEQIRIVKEMRDADRRRGRTGQFVRPRYMVWENVPGAFSSNKGEDFRAVLEETIRVACPEAPDVPLPCGGGWPLADAYFGDGWSVAYRVLDAQFWGVPQRRRRIALVADFGGQSAPGILFERKGVCWDTPEGGETGEAVTAGDGCGTDSAVTVRIRCGCEGGGKGALIQREKSGTLGCNNDQTLFVLNDQGGSIMGVSIDVAGTLRAQEHGHQPVVCAGFKAGNGAKAGGIGYAEEISPTISAASSGTNQAQAVFDARGNGNGETVPTITGDHENRVTDYTALVMATVQENAEIFRDKSPTILAGHEQPVVFDKEVYNSGVGATGGHYISKGGPAPAQRTGHPPGVCAAGIVRRLTPLECERLQGFPSTKKLDVSKMTKDEYIAWNLSVGNIIADCEHGKVFATRGPGGIQLDKPKELKGTILNGYRVVSIRNGTTKLQCRVHRIIWISAHGVLPEGYCIDHINNDKKDNRLSNLQLLTPAENSAKAVEDGLYKTGEDNAATKLSPDLWDEIAYLYDFTDFTIRDLAEIYGVSKSRIHQIIKEVGWTDIGDWTDEKGKVHKTSDAARYKAIGNSIALPPWKWVLKRLCAMYERDATLGSLFDGVGGFSLIWERLNGPGTCLWASEIEEFCIAVTKARFTEEGI